MIDWRAYFTRERHTRRLAAKPARKPRRLAKHFTLPLPPDAAARLLCRVMLRRLT
jgi:hypothetical protein